MTYNIIYTYMDVEREFIFRALFECFPLIEVNSGFSLVLIVKCIACIQPERSIKQRTLACAMLNTVQFIYRVGCTRNSFVVIFLFDFTVCVYMYVHTMYIQ